MITQLELFTPTTTDRYPATIFIDVPFEWVRLDYLLSLPSVDVHEDGLSTEFNREIKRSDWNYEALLNDIAENGYMNPVFVYGEDNGFYPGKETLGNGHHRVVAAFDLGYTHVPVTRDEDDQWTESGVTTR